MAAVRISVEEVNAQKAVFTKAVKNIRNVIEVVRKAQKSIGNDRMTERARESLTKMAAVLEKRAAMFEALAEVLGFAGENYRTGQKHVVSTVSDYRSHKTDFYGNPVHVSGASGGSAAAASATASAGATSSASVNVNASSSGGSAPSYTAAVSAPASSAPAADTGATNVTGNTVINNEETTIVNNYNIYTSEGAGAAGATAVNTAASVGATATVDTASAVGTAGASSGIGALGAVAAGLGGAAAASAGILGGMKIKKEKEKKRVNRELDEARRKLSEIEEEEARLIESLEAGEDIDADVEENETT
jgi:hypothetical protein